jgi:hypothetical protein
VFGLTRESLLFLPLVVGLVLGLIAMTRRQPRVGLVLWLLVLALVPIWFGVTFIAYFPPASAVGFVVLAGLATALPSRFTLADLLVGFFFVSCVVPIAIGGGTLSTLFGAVAIWFVAYGIGRLAPVSIDLDWIYAAVAVIFTVVAALAIIEFVFDFHLYTRLAVPNGAYDAWGQIQVRGALARSEGAFGHSIALGASIALAVPLALGSRFSAWTRIGMTVVMLGGTMATLSRVAIISAALGVVLTIAFVRTEAVRKVRWPMVGAMTLSALVVVPFLWRFFAGAGDEAARSAEYRTRLPELLPSVNALGLSPLVYRSPDGEVYYGQFQSIDSQLIFTALTYGAFALMFGLALLLLAALTVGVGRATPPVVSIVAQVPALATVALITQYSMMFWFVAGLAVASTSHRMNAGPVHVPSGERDVAADPTVESGDRKSVARHGVGRGEV